MAEIQENVVKLLIGVAKEIRPCKACGVLLYFVENMALRKTVPYEEDATNHWRRCPGRDRFRRGGMKHLEGDAA